MNPLPRCAKCDLPGATLRYQHGDLTDWYFHVKCWESVRQDFAAVMPKAEKVEQ